MHFSIDTYLGGIFSYVSLWTIARRIFPTHQACFKAHGECFLKGETGSNGPRCFMQRLSWRYKSDYRYNKSLSSWQVEISSTLYTNPISLIGSQSMICVWIIYLNGLSNSVKFGTACQEWSSTRQWNFHCQDP